VNIEIIRIFTKIRKILLEHKDVFIRIEQFRVDGPKGQIGFKMGEIPESLVYS
jgi:hypothetical protein